MPPGQTVKKIRRGREKRAREKKRGTDKGEKKEEEDNVRCQMSGVLWLYCLSKIKNSTCI